MRISSCRSCKSKNINKVFDLGSQKLSGIFPKTKNQQSIPEGSLSMVFCNNCKLCYNDIFIEIHIKLLILYIFNKYFQNYEVYIIHIFYFYICCYYFYREHIIFNSKIVGPDTTCSLKYLFINVI